MKYGCFKSLDLERVVMRRGKPDNKESVVQKSELRTVGQTALGGNACGQYSVRAGQMLANGDWQGAVWS